MDVHDSVAQAVAVRDGKLVAVGTNAEVESLAGASTQVIDLDGRTAMPGLTDCHVHLASDSSRSVESVECRDLYDPSIDSVEALVTRMGQWAASTPPASGSWRVAARWPTSGCTSAAADAGGTRRRPALQPGLCLVRRPCDHRQHPGPARARRYA